MVGASIPCLIETFLCKTETVVNVLFTLLIRNHLYPSYFECMKE